MEQVKNVFVKGIEIQPSWHIDRHNLGGISYMHVIDPDRNGWENASQEESWVGSSGEGSETIIQFYLYSKGRAIAGMKSKVMRIQPVLVNTTIYKLNKKDHGKENQNV